MKGLPSNIDLTPLSAAMVSHLCFTVAQVQIHFDNGNSIVIESAMVVVSSEKETRIEDYPQGASLLCGFLDDRVLVATREEDGSLLVRFEGGSALHVLNDSRQFESFQVHVAGHTYVA
jgi:hypothetical protein